MTDAVVIGAGQNGLVAANLLVDAGWDVVVLEAEDQPGGAVRSGPLTAPGFTADYFSAFYPLAAASPVIAALDLDAYGLAWCRSPLVVAHPLPDGRCATLSRDVEATCAGLDEFAQGDGAAWADLVARWEQIRAPLLDAIFAPFPPVLPGVRLVASLRRDLLDFVRFALLPLRRLVHEEFRGDGAALLLGGHALHADVAPEQPVSAMFGWLLCMLGHDYGFPVPAGGAGNLTRALARRFALRGGTLVTGARVDQVIVRDGRAVGVRTADGAVVDAPRGVLADVGAPALYLDLVGSEHLPPRVVRDLRRFEYDWATVKVDWALDAPIPWQAEAARAAATIHVASHLDELSDYATQLGRGLVPALPALVMGQMTTADPSRSPAGTESAWAYTHVPQHVRGDAGGDLTGSWDEREAAVIADRVQARIEELAPGFGDRVIARHVFTPDRIQARDANLVGGATNGGTAQLHQQLVFRPIPGLARPETPVANLFLASASAHPGGGVHGACGANAARAALRRDQRRRAVPLAAGAGVALTAALARGRRR